MSEIDRLFAQHGRVMELELDDEFHEHLAVRAIYAKHDVLMIEVLQIHANLPKYYLNLGTGRRAPLIMVGPTDACRFLCVPIEPTRRHGVWRPITAFEANTHHVERYRKD